MNGTVEKTGTAALLAAALTLLLGGATGLAGVRGRALLLDAPSRVTPGNLLICFVNGEERKFEKLVEGPVIDARFSPDGKQVVYGLGGKIMVMDLAARASREVGTYAAELTYFNWGTGDRIYWSDGPDPKKPSEIFCLDLATGQKKSLHKGNAGRTTLSLDGTRAAWVMPPMCAAVGGRQFRFMGGCGGAVSPSGKYLTSNLTTNHNQIGILTFGEAGPSEQPIRTLATPVAGQAINGYFFGRSDDWVCYTVEHPAAVSPTAWIVHWRTETHVELGKKRVVKDFFDEGDLLPAGAELERISICSGAPTDTPLPHEFANVGASRPLRVVGHYRTKDGPIAAAVRQGVSWKADAGKLALSATEFGGVAESGRLTATAGYQGKTASFDVTVLPALTGDGFKAEYFGDDSFEKSVLTRVDPYIHFTWHGSMSPDPAVDGRKPWSVRWTGQLDVQVDGEYTFHLLLGEGNERTIKREGQEDRSCYGLWVDDAMIFPAKGRKNHPWASPTPGAPVSLRKGRHAVRMTVIDGSAHPVVAHLYWSGPGIARSLLGGGYVHSGLGAAGKQ